MTYHKSKLKNYKGDELPLHFTDSKGKKHELDDDERQQTEVYSRVMGYLRPVSVEGIPQWNAGKISEFNERKWFKFPEEAK